MEEAGDADLKTLAKDEQAIEIANGARLLLERTIDNVLICEIVVEKFKQCFRVSGQFPMILNYTIDQTKLLLASARYLTWKEKAKVDVVLKLARHSSEHVDDIKSFFQLNTKVEDWRNKKDGTARLLDVIRE